MTWYKVGLVIGVVVSLAGILQFAVPWGVGTIGCVYLFCGTQFILTFSYLLLGKNQQG